jgi:hypothetical protein
MEAGALFWDTFMMYGKQHHVGQHSSSSTNQHSSPQIKFVRICEDLWIRFPIPHFIFTRKKKLLACIVPNAPPNIGLVIQSFTAKAIWLKKEFYTNKLT